MMSTIARGGTASLLGAGVSAVAGFVLVLVIAQRYPPQVAGAFFAITSIFLVASALVELGVDQGLVRFIPWYRARDHGDRVPHLYRVAILPVIAAGTVLAAVGIVLAKPIAEVLAPGPDVLDVAGALRVLALAAPVAALYEIVLSATRGYGLMKPTVLVERVGRPLLQLVLVCAAAFSGADLVVLALAWTLPYAPGLLLGALALRRARQQHDPARAIAATAIGREFWSYTAARGLARTCQVALQRADIAIVAAVAGPADAALYTAATRFLVVGQLTLQAVQQVMQPSLAHLLAVGDDEVTGVVFRRVTSWCVALTWPPYLLCAAAAPVLMGLFGPEYVDGAPSLVILALTMAAATAIGAVDVLLLMAGRSTLSFVNLAVALALDVVLCLLLIPTIGLIGAAVARAVSVLVRNLLCLLQVKHYLGFRSRSRSLVAVMAIATTLFGLVPALVVWAGLPMGALVTATAGGTFAYGWALWLLRSSLGLDAFVHVLRRRRRIADGQSSLPERALMGHIDATRAPTTATTAGDSASTFGDASPRR